MPRLEVSGGPSPDSGRSFSGLDVDDVEAGGDALTRPDARPAELLEVETQVRGNFMFPNQPFERTSLDAATLRTSGAATNSFTTGGASERCPFFAVAEALGSPWLSPDCGCADSRSTCKLAVPLASPKTPGRSTGAIPETACRGVTGKGGGPIPATAGRGVIDFIAGGGAGTSAIGIGADT